MGGKESLLSCTDWVEGSLGGEDRIDNGVMSGNGGGLAR